MLRIPRAEEQIMDLRELNRCSMKEALKNDGV